MGEHPSHEVMSTMAKIALEQATLLIAQRAREFSRSLPDTISGAEALIAFANAIEATNAKVFPPEGQS